MKDRSRKGRNTPARHEKKPRSQFFKFPEPYYNDELLRNRAEILSSEKDLRYNQSNKTRSPKLPKGKKAQEQEILAKETKQTSGKKVSKKKKKK